MSFSQHGLLEIETYNIIHNLCLWLVRRFKPAQFSPRLCTLTLVSALVKLSWMFLMFYHCYGFNISTINVLWPSAVGPLPECPNVLWSFCRRDSGRGSHPLYQDSHRSHHRVPCRQYIGTVLSGLAWGRQTSPCGLEISGILFEERHISFHFSVGGRARWWPPRAPQQRDSPTTCSVVESPLCNMMIVPQLCIASPVYQLEVVETMGLSETVISWLEAETDAARWRGPGSHCIYHSHSP